MPMNLEVDFIHDVAPHGGDERILLLMLPGARNTPQQLADYGFIQALRRRGLPVDVLALAAHADLYLNQADIERLLHRTLDEMKSLGYRRIWLFGISLGGTGAMICATQRTSEIDGVILLAPFLGTRGLIAEITDAGGLRNWRPGKIAERDHERALLDGVRLLLTQNARWPTMHLGYGSEDHYRGASDLLAVHLPGRQVRVMAGGHDWKTWAALWEDILDREPFRMPVDH